MSSEVERKFLLPSLWPLTESRRLTKIRHFIPIAEGLIAGSMSSGASWKGS